MAQPAEHSHHDKGSLLARGRCLYELSEFEFAQNLVRLDFSERAGLGSELSLAVVGELFIDLFGPFFSCKPLYDVHRVCLHAEPVRITKCPLEGCGKLRDERIGGVGADGFFPLRGCLLDLRLAKQRGLDVSELRRNVAELRDVGKISLDLPSSVLGDAPRLASLEPCLEQFLYRSVGRLNVLSRLHLALSLDLRVHGVLIRVMGGALKLPLESCGR